MLSIPDLPRKFDFVMTDDHKDTAGRQLSNVSTGRVASWVAYLSLQSMTVTVVQAW